MKIALIVPGGVDRSGKERVIPVLLELIERLARHHDVLVVALDQERERCRYPLLGATIVNLGNERRRSGAVLWTARCQRLIATLHAEGPFDVLHAAWIQGPGSLAVAAGRLMDIPVVSSICGGELVWLPSIGYGGQGRWRGRLQASLVLRLSQGVSGYSRYALDACNGRRGDAHWVPMGVDARRFSGPVERPAGPPWRLLHVASLNRVKDQITLLRAMRLVLNRCPEVRLDCIGADTLGNSVQEGAAALGLNGSVRFLGFQPLGNIMPYYRQAHVMVQSSLHEAGGAAVMEAAAAGVPAVGTAVGILAEMAPQAAVAVPVGNPGALAEGILALLSNRERRVELGRRAQQFAQTYDADWTAAQFEALYAGVTGRQG